MATKQLVIVLLTLLLALRPGAQKVLTEPESEANPMPVGMERDRSHQIQALEEQLARLRLEEQILASEAWRIKLGLVQQSFDISVLHRTLLVLLIRLIMFQTRLASPCTPAHIRI